ncbi:MAG TPA: TIGR01777 family oxidoreductase [Chitinophagaceae bacterium]|nr:TIGR01777 family oxidoreductase [Chitinophagaceae bacterium]
MATVLITGGTGMIGKALTKALTNKGYDIIILTRSKKNQQNSDNISYAAWDIDNETIDEEAVKKSDAIIHLAGANVGDGRWTDKRKKEIVDSRVKSGALLVNVLKSVPNKIQTVVSASAIGWYGEDAAVPNKKPFTETDVADSSFLGHTCVQWEAAIKPVKDLEKRLVIYRIGIVLSNEGGAYAEFKKPLNFGIASILGSGKQMVSWIHIDDVVNLFVTALENKNISGVYNAVAPNPVSNKQLILSMAKAKDSLFLPAPVPQFVLKTMLGEMSVEVLKSATVSAQKIEKEGYQFLFPTIDTATFNLTKKASG